MNLIETVTINGTQYSFSGGSETRSSYEEKGDFFTLLASAEDVSMAQENKRIYLSSGTYIAQNYANNTIHYYNPALIPYDRVLVRRVANGWSVFTYYNPSNETYTLMSSDGLASANTSRLFQLDTIPEGCYLAVSAPNSNYKEGYNKYLGRIWINPNYVAKFEGLDESACSEPIPVDLAPVDYSGYPYFYIDLSKYENMLVRMVRNSSMGSATAGFCYSDTISNTSKTATYFAFDEFSPWIYESKYLIFFFRSSDFTTSTFDITLGWIDPDVAIKQKRKRYFGIDLSAHNTDTKDLLVHACVWSSVVDIDICRTLDGHYVCIHATTINGHTIAETNLEDLELTYNQIDLDEAIKIMQMYETSCFTNIRETTLEQHADVAEKIYAKLGRAYVYDTYVVTAEDNPLHGHASKFYGWKNTCTIDQMVAAGFDINKIVAGWNQTSENYTYHDWIPSTMISAPTSAADIPQDRLAAICFVQSNIKNILNG